MKISKTHKSFSDLLDDPKALTNPEDFLGPNWEDVTNFWLYVDTLSEDEIDKMNDPYWDLDEDVLDSAYVIAKDAATEVVGEEVRDAAWWATRYSTFRAVFTQATYEIIGHHKILQQNKTLLALPFCLKP
jgi:hypothetical protein